MKIKKNALQTARLTLDAQNRLFAYTTAAGLGAFFAGQNAEAQVTASLDLAPWPHTLTPGTGTGLYHNYHYLDIDGTGGSTPVFNLNVVGWRVDMSGTPSSTNLVLNPTSNAYVIPWTNGLVVTATNSATPSSIPTYKRFLANSVFRYSAYLFNNFPTNGEAVGFEFLSTKDNQIHFGYMDIQVNGAPGVFGDFTATVAGIYYEATPNTPITIGALPAVVVTVTVTNISVGAGHAVTINFTSSDNAAASTFTLQTTPVLGAAASWVADSGAVITSNAPGVYTAVTTGTGGAAQFYRIIH